MFARPNFAAITVLRFFAAEVHDSQKFVDLLDENDEVAWADSAYVGAKIAEEIAKKYPTCLPCPAGRQEIKLRIIEKATRGHPLTCLPCLPAGRAGRDGASQGWDWAEKLSV